MKVKYYVMMLVSMFTIASCDSSLDVEAEPEFTVSTKKSTYKVGEEVLFNLTGNPGILTFYSGLFGNDYAFREGRILSVNDLKLSFNSNVNYGSQANQFSVLISTDFNGQYNIGSIKAATWIDITDRFTLPATNNTYVNSGVADITDLRVAGKPMYFVLKYVYTPGTTVARTWSIQGFNLQSNTSNGLLTLTDQVGANFGLYYSGPKEETGRSGITATTITLRGNTVAPPEVTEDWCISRAVDVGDVDLGPDRPESVKGYSEARRTTFPFVYDTPGTYKVYFTGLNVTKKETKTVQKDLTITIEP